MNIAIIFAGGRGLRLNDEKNSLPKQFLNINDKPILIHTLMHFQNHPQIDKIYIAVLDEYKTYTQELIDKYKIDKTAALVSGGECAQESIYNALLCAYKQNHADSVVLIHDGVRPVITKKVITNNIESVKQFGTAITATPSYETILVSPDGTTLNNVPLRKETYKAQAPQSFVLKEIFEAHKIIRAKCGYDDIVDSCTLYHMLKRKCHLVEGNFGNIKVTTPEDVYILEGILKFKNDTEGGKLNV